jgi:hypothetical protein
VNGRRWGSPSEAVSKAEGAKSRLLPRVYVSRTSKVNVVHFPPGTKFYGDPIAGSGKAHVPLFDAPSREPRPT